MYSQVREILEGSNPGRTYSTGLLSRVIRRGKEMHFGKDPDCMTNFMEAGYAIRASGGAFRYAMDMTLQLSTISIQARSISFAMPSYW
jgi:hypothetical protein